MTLLNHTIDDLIRIRNHTLKSFKNDVIPLFNNSQVVGPDDKIFHFGIIRQVMAYIEFCSAIYCGWTEKNNKGQFDSKKVTTSKKAIRFIEEQIGKIDRNYRRNGKLFYVMFRHGSTHLLRPHCIKRKNSKFQFTWQWYSGPRQLQLKLDNGKNFTLKNLELFRKNSREFELHVSIECIINDTYNAIKDFFDDLIRYRKSKKLPIKQRRALTFISEGIVKRGDI